MPEIVDLPDPTETTLGVTVEVVIALIQNFAMIAVILVLVIAAIWSFSAVAEAFKFIITLGVNPHDY